MRLIDPVPSEDTYHLVSLPYNPGAYLDWSCDLASIYLLRGLFIIPILIWPQLRSPFNIWSSLIVLGYGLVYAVGTWRVWPSISTNARKSKELVT